MSTNQKTFLRIGFVIAIIVYLFAFFTDIQIRQPSDNILPTQAVLQDRNILATEVPPVAENPVQDVIDAVVEDPVVDIAKADSDVPIAESLESTESVDVVEGIPAESVSVTANSYQSEARVISFSQQSVPNQVVLRFDSSATPAEREAYITSLNGTVVSTIDSLDTVVLQVSEDVASASLESDLLVISEPDYYASAQVTGIGTSDPLSGQQWGLSVMNIPSAWETLPASEPLTVAVIDSGVCVDHPDLAGKITSTWDFVEGDATAQDEFGHGCGVAGIIGAQIDNGIGIAGVAPNVEIMGLRVLDESGIGAYSNVAAAIVYAVDNGADIMNLSLGGLFPSAILEDAILYALDHNVTVIAAAGNTGNNDMTYPAAYGGVISVGSIDPDFSTSGFSSTHPAIDLKAPGRDVLVTTPEGSYTLQSGTSYAAPYVTGLAALEMAHGRSLTLHGGLAVFGDESTVDNTTNESVAPAYTQSSKLDSHVVDLLNNKGKVEVIVSLREPAVALGDNDTRALAIAQTQQTVFAQLNETGFQLGHQYHRLSAFSGIIDREAANVLAMSEDVLFITRDLPIYSHGDESYSLVGSDLLHQSPYNLTGQGQTIAVLDTGFDPENSFFDKNGDGKYDNIIAEACFLIENGVNVCDIEVGAGAAVGLPKSHGTNVAAIVSKVAPDAKIVMVKILSQDGSGGASDWLAALDYISNAKYNNVPIFKDISIINMSLGTNLLYGPSPSSPSLSCDAERPIEFGIVSELANQGVTMVASSGNNGGTLTPAEGGYKNFVSVPACLSDVIAVGATYTRTGNFIPPANAFGEPRTYREAMRDDLFPECFDQNVTVDTITCFTNSNPWLKLVAPGSDILAAGVAYTGTSQASPHVAGAAALLREADFSLDNAYNLSPEAIVDLLISNGPRVTDANNNVTATRLDILAAVRSFIDGINPGICGTDITQLTNTAECEGLVRLYNSLGGSNWTNNNWFSNNLPCGSLDGSIAPWVGLQCNGSRNTITAIDFASENGLDGYLPPSLGDFPNLVFLNMSNQANLRGVIPTTISNLNNLSTIKFENNPQLQGPLPQFPIVIQNIFITNNPSLDGRLPSSISTLAGLVNLDLSNNALFGDIIFPDTSAFEIVTLDLSNNQLTGNLSDLTGYVNLVTLDLSNNDLSGTIPTTVGNLESLEILDLSHNGISGAIPTELGSDGFFSNLRILNLSNNKLSGTIPAMFVGLETLDLSHNQLTGGIDANTVLNIPALTTIDLSYNRLNSGNITITSPNLEVVNLSHNRIPGHMFIDFGGTSTVPVTPNLRVLDVNTNQISGDVCATTSTNSAYGLFDPVHIMSNLEYYDVSRNNMSITTVTGCGGLPSSTDWSGFTSLRHFDISSNAFTNLPSGSIVNLDTYAQIPDHVDGEPDHFRIDYNGFNLFLNNGQWDAAYDFIRRKNPSAFETQVVFSSSATAVATSTNTAVVTWSFPEGTALEELNGQYILRWNPIEIFVHIRGDAFTESLSVNEMTVGNLIRTSSNPVSVEVYPIQFSPEDPDTRSGGYGANFAELTLPPSVCDSAGNLNLLNAPGDQCKALENLYCSTTAYANTQWTNDSGWKTVFDDCQSHNPDNFITVDACDFYGITCNELGHIIGISLPNNNLVGMLAGNLGDMQFLQTLDLSHNQLVGHIPNALFAGIAPLRHVNLSFNQLTNLKDTDAISGLLGKPTLLSLQLRNNNLTGVLPSGWYVPNLEVLDLTNNQLVGEITSAFLGGMNKIHFLHLGGNQLEGFIPTAIGNLPQLVELDLRDNQFDGSIPDSLGNTTLQILNLSNNQLTGEIPASLGNLTYLLMLDLHGNQLTGSFPNNLSTINLQRVDVSENALSGVIPSQLQSAPLVTNNTILREWENALTGGLYIDYNAFSGSEILPSILDNMLIDGTTATFKRQAIAPDPTSIEVIADPTGFTVTYAPVNVESPTTADGYYQLWCSVGTRPAQLFDESFSLDSDLMNVIGLPPDTVADCYIQTVITDFGLASEPYTLVSDPGATFTASTYTAQQLAEMNPELPIFEGGTRVTDVFNNVAGFEFDAEECAIGSGGAGAAIFGGGGAGAAIFGGGGAGAAIFGGGGAGAAIFGGGGAPAAIFGGGGAGAAIFGGGTAMFGGGGAGAAIFGGGGAPAAIFGGGGAGAAIFGGGGAGAAIFGGGTEGSNLDTVTYLYFVDYDTFDANIGLSDIPNQPGLTLIACSDNSTENTGTGATTTNLLADNNPDSNLIETQPQVDVGKATSFVSVLAQPVRLPDGNGGYIDTVVFSNPISGQPIRKANIPESSFDPNNPAHVTILDPVPEFNANGQIVYDENWQVVEGKEGDDLLFIVVFKETPPENDPNTTLQLNFNLTSAAQASGVPTGDANALRAIFDSLGGPAWASQTDPIILGNRAPWFAGYSNPCGRDGIANSVWYGVTCNSANEVIAIDLSDNNLVGQLPTAIGNFQSLTNLNLENNKITGNIPSTIGKLTSLSQLDLSNNGLSGEIPSTITALTGLRLRNTTTGQAEGLDLGLNQLTATDTSLVNFLNNRDPDLLANLYGAPTNFRVATRTDNSIELKWDGVSVSGYYEVYCSLKSANTLELCGQTQSTAENSLVLEGFFPGTPYLFKVRTVFSGTNSVIPTEFTPTVTGITTYNAGLPVMDGVLTLLDSASALPFEYDGLSKNLPGSASIPSSCDAVSGKVTVLKAKGSVLDTTASNEILFVELDGSACVSILDKPDDVVVTTYSELVFDSTTATNKTATAQVVIDPTREYTVLIVSQGDVRLTIDSRTNFAPQSSGIAIQTLAEDSPTPLAIDLTTVFSDDTTPSNQLTFAIIDTDEDAPFNATINGTTLEVSVIPDANGIAQVTIRATDLDGASASESIEIEVTPVDDAVIANDDSFSIDEDQQIVIPVADLLANDSDVDGAGVISAVTQPATNNATVTYNQTAGTVTFKPKANVNGVISFGYTLTGNSSSDTATVTVTVNAVDDAPVAITDSVVLDEDTPITIDVLANDIEVDGQILTVSITGNPTKGTATLNVNQTITYTPNANYNGSDIFVYSITDGISSDSVAVSLTVNPVNDRPVGEDKSYSTAEDTTLTISSLNGLLVNASDVDGDALRVRLSSISSTSHGQLTINPNGSFTYIPDANFNGTDIFSYRIYDYTANSAERYTATITVTPVNDKPVAVNDSASTPEDTAVTIDVVSNDTDIDGDSLFIHTVASTSTDITYSVVANQLVVTPDTDFVGTAILTYYVKDSNGAISVSSATVTVTVISTNDAPVISVPIAQTTNEDVALDIAGLSVVDADGDNLSMSLSVDHGTLQLSSSAGLTQVVGDNTGAMTFTGSPANVNVAIADLTYTPDSNYNGADTLAITAVDPSNEQDTKSLSIQINAVNDPPTAGANSAILDEDTSVDINVLGNDSAGPADEDQTLTIVSVSTPQKGVASINPDQTIHYVPNADRFGADSFTYTVRDSSGATATATVSVQIIAVNDAPVATDDIATTTEDTPVDIFVLVNDNVGASNEAQTLSITAVTQPANGSVTIIGGTSVKYQPDSNFTGTDTFTYTIVDSGLNSQSDTATVTITVNGVNDAPVAVADSYTATEDTALVVNSADGLLKNDTDVEGDTLTAIKVSNPSKGTLTAFNGNGSFTYTPALNQTGSDSFTYKVNDGLLDSAPVTVTITISAVNDVPVASDDAVTTSEDNAVTINVRANDTDVEDGQPTIHSITSAPSNGSAVLNADQSIIYTPNSNYNGVDSFTYDVRDSQGASDTATVTVTVNSVNDAPVAVNDSATTDEDTAVTIDVLFNDTDADNNPLTVSAVNVPAGNGSATIISNKVRYTPPANASGLFTFSYTVIDGKGGSDTANVNVTVNSVNDVPVAVNDTATTAEDTAILINVLNNDTDADGDTLTVSIQSQPTHGSVALVGSDVEYTPDANYNGADSFTYKVEDGNGGSDTATVNVTVNSVNDAPIAVNDAVTTNEDTTIVISVLANDTDTEDGQPTLDDVTLLPAHGAVQINATSITYTPNANYNGSDSFTYSVKDSDGEADTAVVTITVSAVNDAPIAVQDMYNIPEDNVLNVYSTEGVLKNDTDIDGDSLSAVIVSTTSNGTLTLHGDGSFMYIPDLNYFGLDSFQYKANDGTTTSNTVTVTISITSDNDAPIAVNDHYNVNEDSSINMNVIENDIDPEDGPLVTSILGQPANGTVVRNADNTLTYTPAPNFNGTVSFDYMITDDIFTDMATVTIIVNPVNDAPIASGNSYSTDEDTPLTIPASGVLGNDSDIDGDTLTAVLDATVANGTLTLNANGSFTYTPSANYNGSDSFSYHANDGELDSNTVTVNITVNAVNDVPVAKADSYSTDEDTLLSVPANGILGNDTDTENDTLTAVLINGVSNGSLTFNTNGAFEYMPDADFNGSDSFTYQANDGTANSTTVTVTLIVNAVNDAPVANGESYETDEDITLTVNAPGVLGNDTDTENDTLNAILDATVVNGSLTLNADGSFTYTPDTNYFGTDSFTYHANDGELDSGIVTVYITINAVNDIPVATGESYETAEDTALTINAPGVLANDTDEDGDTLSAISVTDPSHGSLTLNADGSFTYTPFADYFGADSFTYKANDTQADSNTVTVSLTVTSVNDAPVAIDNSATTNEDTSVPIDVLSNDNAGPANEVQTLSITSVTSPAHGSAVANADGTITYTPSADYFGADSFTYTVADSDGLTDTATVNMTVLSINDAPVAVNDIVDTLEDVPVIIAVLTNDNAGPANEDQTLNIISIVAPSNGIIVNNGNGTITYTPDANYFGTDSFTYTTADTGGLTASAIVSLTIESVNDAPVANNDSYTVNAGSELVISPAQSVLNNDSDPIENDPITVNLTTVSDPANGYLSMNTDGTFSYYPKSGFVGTDTFTYQADDGQTENNLSNEATVTIDVLYVPGTLRIIKDAIPDSGRDWRFVGSLGEFFLEDNAPDKSSEYPNMMTFANLDAGSLANMNQSYDITEFNGLNTASWELTNIDCGVQNAHPLDTGALKSTLLSDGITVRIDLLAGQRISCTFINRRLGKAQVLVFDDLNADGEWQNEKKLREPLVTDATITMEHTETLMTYTSVTNKHGVAMFTDLPVGLYEVCETLPAGWNASGATVNANGQACLFIEVLSGQTSRVVFANYQETTQAMSAYEDYPQLMESDDTRITSAGIWGISSDRVDASNGTYLHSLSADATLEMQFMGTSAQIEYLAGPTRGGFTVEVDGVLMLTVDSYSEDVSTANYASIDGLTNAEHTLRIMSVDGATIAIDAIFARGLIVESAEDLPQQPTEPTATPVPTEETVIIIEATPTTEVIVVEPTATMTVISSTTETTATVTPTLEPVSTTEETTVIITPTLDSVSSTETTSDPVIEEPTPLPTIEPTATLEPIVEPTLEPTPLPTIEPTATLEPPPEETPIE